MQNFKRATACLFIFVGGIGLPTAFLSLFNPLGAKIYDAGDPLGSPVPFSESMLVICIYLFLLVIGIGLAASSRRNSETS